MITTPVAALRGPWDHGCVRGPTLLVAVAAVSVAVAACGRDPSSAVWGQGSGSATSVGEVTVEVEVADSPGERRVGLMNRRSLPEEAGMVFLFPEPSDGGFWMKNTLIP